MYAATRILATQKDKAKAFFFFGLHQTRSILTLSGLRLSSGKNKFNLVTLAGKLCRTCTRMDSVAQDN